MDGNAKLFVDKMRTILAKFEDLPYSERKKRLSMMQNPFPEKLYHYRGHSGPNDEQNLHDCLVESQMFLRAPKDFNDPFECHFQFGQLGETTALHDRLVKAATAQGASQKQIRNICPGILKIGRDEIARFAKEDTNRRFQAMGIFCLCESYKDILMWAHYGQHHHGVCIEFDVTEGVRTFGLCKKVRYEGSMPMLDYPEKDLKDLAAPIFRKAEQWCYEQEWRIAIPSGSHQKLEFPPSAVSSIIYGCEATSETHEIISRLLKKRCALGYAPVKELELKRSDDDYMLIDVCPVPLE